MREGGHERTSPTNPYRVNGSTGGDKCVRVACGVGFRTQRRRVTRARTLPALSWESILTILSHSDAHTFPEQSFPARFESGILGWMTWIILPHAFGIPIWGHSILFSLLIFLSRFLFYSLAPYGPLRAPQLIWESVRVGTRDNTRAFVRVLQHALHHKPGTEAETLPFWADGMSGWANAWSTGASQTGQRIQCLLFTHSPLLASCWVCRIRCSLRSALSLCSSPGVGTVSNSRCQASALWRWNALLGFSFHKFITARDSFPGCYDSLAYTPPFLHSKASTVWCLVELI